MYLKIIIFGAGLFLLFRTLSFFRKRLTFSGNVEHYSMYVLPFIELVTWLGFAIWFVQLLFESKSYTTLLVFGIVILLLLFPLWLILRDFLLGMQLIMQRKIELHSQIETEEVSGEIVKIEHLSFDIKTKNGNIDTIPYNKIRTKIISKTGENVNLEKQLMRFHFSAKNDVNIIVEQLKISLLNSPWVAPSQPPIIDNISIENESHVIDVYVYLLKKDYTEKIRQYVKRTYERNGIV